MCKGETPMTLNRSRLFALLGSGVTLALIAAASADGQTRPNNPRATRVERGRYLVTIAACHDCHSPKVDAQMTPDAARALSGRPITTLPPVQATTEIRASLDLTAWAGPWGNSYAANLTPDGETGLGRRYTEASFVETIRTGKKPEGEMLAPPMPWNVYRNMTDEDLKSIYAYLKTLKPVRNAVRQAPQVTSARR
jgi:mono/diheme cytochrome c family protein